MQIFIDGKEAALKKGSSFEFISENRLFSGSDAFTLSIEFPLRGCRQNLDIFGWLSRPEINPSDLTFDCEIRERNFSRLGTLTVMEVTETMVSAQFLEGRAAHNANTDLDETYVNELDLGQFPSQTPSDITPAEAWNPETTGHEFVALPWVSADSDSGIIHNLADRPNLSFEWNEDTRQLSWQIYLLPLVKRICKAIGYSYDLAQWENHSYLSKILVCNCLPPAWDLVNVCRILPHWTVPEFFEKLELFIRGEFDFDHREKSISFQFSSSALDSVPAVRLEKVVDELTISVNDEEPDCDYLDAQNIAYKNEDHQRSKFYECDWLIESIDHSRILHYPDIDSMIEANKSQLNYPVNEGNHRGDNWNYGKILHVEDTNRYFVFVAIGKDAANYHYILQLINEFGKRIADKRTDDTTEIEFIPACIDFTEEKYGNCLFVKCGSYSEDEESTLEDTEDALPKSGLLQMIESGEKDSPTEYFSTVSVGYYDGREALFGSTGNLHYPYPAVSNIMIRYTESSPWGISDVRTLPFSLSINDPSNTLWTPKYQINPARRYVFKFLSDTIPNPRALFYIGGRRYVCEKITATFTESGMSQLLKGEFFALADD